MSPGQGEQSSETSEVVGRGKSKAEMAQGLSGDSSA